MKNRIYTLILLLFIMSSPLSATEFAGGNGSAASPFLVSNAQQLDMVRFYPDKHFLQTHDIELSVHPYNQGFTPICGGGTTDFFTGQYDGNHKEIRNLLIMLEGIDNVGLFGHVGYKSNGQTIIKNVVLTNASVTGGRSVGLLAGRVTGNQNTLIERCSAHGKVIGDAVLGGLVGSNNSHVFNNGAAEGFRPIIHACFTNVEVKLRAAAPVENMIKFGGIAGCNMKGLISNCYSMGKVTIDSPHAKYVGGLVGIIEERGIVINSYSTADVVTHANVTDVGALVGNKSLGSLMGKIHNSYYDGTITFTDGSPRPDNSCGERKTTAELKNLSTISTAYKDWDFALLWHIDGLSNSGYPFLRNTPPSITTWLWQGGTTGFGNSWEKNGNWTDTLGNALEGYPGDVIHKNCIVIIPVSVNPPRAELHELKITKLILKQGGQLDIAEGNHIIISGSLSVSDGHPLPVVNGPGKIILSGSMQQDVPNMIIQNLTIDNYNNTKLTGDVIITGLLEMKNGLLDLNGYEIDLGTTGSLSEYDDINFSSRVYGTSGLIRAVRTTENINQANLGIELYFSSIDNPGIITISRGHSELTGTGTSKSILRWFNISPQNNMNLDATLIFHYFVGDLTYTKVEPSFSLFKRPINGGPNDWQFINSQLDAQNQRFIVENVSSFSQWTATSSSIALPVKLLSFDAKVADNTVILSWQTASEINNDYFSVERSIDLIDFTAIAMVEGAGTISNGRTYQITDENPVPKISYYRLKQTDFDGTSAYSAIVSVQLMVEQKNQLTIFPNPNHGIFNITIDSEEPEEYQVFDLQGRCIIKGTAFPLMNNKIHLPSAARGIYLFQVAGDNGKTQKIYIF
jgi:hypothetical protein